MAELATLLQELNRHVENLRQQGMNEQQIEFEIRTHPSSARLVQILRRGSRGFGSLEEGQAAVLDVNFGCS